MMIRNILIITVIAALVPTAMSNVSASAGSEITLFSGVSDSDGLLISGNGDSAKMELKATNDNGKLNRVSDFQLTADNVLSTEVGDMATVNDNVDFTKAITTDARNNQKAIGITSNGVIDFAGYTQGVYTLDVVVDDDRAYEAIIVIGGQTHESVKSVNKEITFEIYNGTGGSGNFTKGNNTSGGGSGNITRSGSGSGGNMTENGNFAGSGGSNMTIGGSGGSGGDNMTGNENFAGSGGDGGSNMTQGITQFATVPEPVNPCIKDPQSEECEQIRSQSCDALGCPGYPILEPEPEPIECDEGEELVDGQCQPTDTNPVEPTYYDDPKPIGDDCEPGFIDSGYGCESEETLDKGSEDNPSVTLPGCSEPNAQGQCYIGMPGEKLPTPIEEPNMIVEPTPEPEPEPIVFPDNSVEFPTEEIDCELQPELCEEIPNIPLEETEEEELPEEEELTETTEFEEIEEEEEEVEESGESEEVENEESKEESEGGN